MATKLHKVFVYGTLKRGEPNHIRISKCKLGHCKFLCNAETTEQYPLIIGTKYNIPFLLFSPGKGHYVQGELYEVDDYVLSDLDELEDHPNYYIREEHSVRCTDTDSVIKAWIYFIKNFKQSLLERTMYRNYSSNGEHGLKYVERYMRNETAPKDDILNDSNEK